MFEHFESICYHLFSPTGKADPLPVFNPAQQFTDASNEPAGIARQLNAAFLILLAGNKHLLFEKARAVLHRATHSDKWSPVAQFYLSAKDRIRHELENTAAKDPDLADRIKNLSRILETADQYSNASQITEEIWKLFFPEGVGLASSREESIGRLRQNRAVKITRPNPKPIIDPASQILFSSNVLLTLPPEPPTYDHLPISEDLKQQLGRVSREAQLYWYDHPIHIGVQPPHNELLYGLHGLVEALRFERMRGTAAKTADLTCILSASVTHEGLHELARPYIEDEISRADFLNHINVYVFTENDTRRILKDILVPAAEYFLQSPEPANELEMFGVDGEYGRHYSFLKAMAAFWNVFIDPRIKATFKIDLDQVFPQQILVEQTGASAFEHFMTSLWGAHGTDIRGKPIELGMIAGALVNQSDIDKSLFSADVPFPDRALSPEEHIFFSALPQAISTEAEMMTRYRNSPHDGVNTCIQRVHVTGGTNGIRIDSLRRHRPFTPSFIGRAEDQAYLLSAINSSGESLAYVHKDGLIMRHDKEAFAREAIASAEIGRTVGDYVRMLYFSGYAGALPVSKKALKEILDPFTGCFISKIPQTVVHLRFALKAATLFRDNQTRKGLELVKSGAERISKALEFVRGESSALRTQYERERHGWNLYYDILDAVEEAIEKKDPFAVELRKKAQAIIQECKIS
ncbi:hypothetical protein ACFL2S_11480 [Thermodesulfobacteriota bacterium]